MRGPFTPGTYDYNMAEMDGNQVNHDEDQFAWEGESEGPIYCPICAATWAPDVVLYTTGECPCVHRHPDPDALPANVTEEADPDGWAYVAYLVAHARAEGLIK